MISTCKHCGKRINNHCNIHLTCPKCGKPHCILSKISIIGILDGYTGEVKMVPVSSSSRNMYYYDNYSAELDCFISNENELYKINSWFGHK